MAVTVYVISDPIAINFLVDEDIDGFKEYLDSDDMLDFPAPELFETEQQALAFCSGIGYGANERATPERYPLRSCEESDLPFIEAIENYWFNKQYLTLVCKIPAVLHTNLDPSSESRIFFVTSHSKRARADKDHYVRNYFLYNILRNFCVVA